MTPPTPTRAYAVWGVALLSYVVAVFHRASLGVAAVPMVQRGNQQTVIKHARIGRPTNDWLRRWGIAVPA